MIWKQIRRFENFKTGNFVNINIYVKTQFQQE